MGGRVEGVSVMDRVGFGRGGVRDEVGKGEGFQCHIRELKCYTICLGEN